MILTPGFCLRWPDARIMRILVVGQSLNVAWLIDCEAADALPIPYAIDDNDLQQARVLQDDPYTHLRVGDECFSVPQCARRDERLEFMAPLLWDEQGDIRTDILDSDIRGQAVRALVAQTGRAKDTITDCLRRFWQRGMIPNALIPDTQRSGGEGKRKTLTRKHGRPSRLEQERGTQGEGFIVDDTAREKMLRGYKKHYIHNKHNDLHFAYESMLNDEFADYAITDDGRKPVVHPPGQIPTYWQFEYWCHQQGDKKKTSEGRKGKRRHQREHGAKPGDSTEAALGPGSIVQADWTYGPQLVSSYDYTTPIGRAVILFFICVFSRLVVGFHVGLREDWESVLLGFENMATPKKTVYAALGFPYDDDGEEYACIPGVLAIDGGKVDVRNASGIVHLGTTVDTAPRYMPQIKAIVEKLNHLIKRKLARYLGSPKKIAFDDPDPRLSAWVDLNTCRGLVGDSVLEQNTEVIETYPLAEDMDKAGVIPAPVELWKFGKAYRCLPKMVDLSIVRQNLLPRDLAVVTPQAITFKGLEYTCENAQQWHERAGLKRRKRYTMTVAYHPGLVDYIYVYEKERLVDICTLAGVYQKFSGLCQREVEEHFDATKRRIAAYEESALQQRVERSASMRDQVQQAREEVAENRRGMSKRAIREGGGEKREQEVRQQSKQQAWTPEDVGAEPASSESQSQDAEDPETLTNQDTDIPPQYAKQQGQDGSESQETTTSSNASSSRSSASSSNKHDILRRIQERKLNNEEE